MAESGISMVEIARYLAHKDSRTTERVYAKLAPNFLKNASAALVF
jgi:integrase